jgi:phosphatidylserine decarboxylase
MALMEPSLGFARSVWKFFIPLAVLTALFAFLGWYIAAAIVLILAVYVLYFFRDPERKTPGIPNSVCSPADGVVASVLEVPAKQFPEGKAMRIAIFLNIFNVHVQRIPVSGRVTKVEQRAGRCMNAMNEKCSEENEAVTVWLDTNFGPIGVRQLSGAIARRIICFAREGDELERGDRYGVIQFASRVEIFLPINATIKVQPGQKVTGGETCMAVLFEEEVRKGVTRDRRSQDQVPITMKAG